MKFIHRNHRMKSHKSGLSRVRPTSAAASASESESESPPAGPAEPPSRRREPAWRPAWRPAGRGDLVTWSGADSWIQACGRPSAAVSPSAGRRPPSPSADRRRVGPAPPVGPVGRRPRRRRLRSGRSSRAASRSLQVQLIRLDRAFSSHIRQFQIFQI